MWPASVLDRHPARRRVLSRTPVQPAFAASPAGWHTRELVEEARLGRSFEELCRKGVLAERQPEGISPIGQLVALPAH
jgi:hypothetical protein